MTRRDVGWLCNFTPHTALREIAQPYRFWGLFGFPPRSEGRILTETSMRVAEYNVRPAAPVSRGRHLPSASPHYRRFVI